MAFSSIENSQIALAVACADHGLKPARADQQP
jgi:hypothetical protein